MDNLTIIFIGVYAIVVTFGNMYFVQRNKILWEEIDKLKIEAMKDFDDIEELKETIDELIEEKEKIDTEDKLKQLNKKGIKIKGCCEDCENFVVKWQGVFYENTRNWCEKMDVEIENCENKVCDSFKPKKDVVNKFIKEQENNFREVE